MKINQDYVVLSPAYGRDAKSKAEAERLFRSGRDFLGDCNIGFKLCSIRDFVLGVKVEIRYAKLSKAVIVVV